MPRQNMPRQNMSTENMPRQNMPRQNMPTQNIRGSRGGRGGGGGRGGSRGGGRGGGGRGRQSNISFTNVPVTVELIGTVVGKRGVTINKIKDSTNTRISHLEPDPGNGHLFHSFHISGSSVGVEKARKWILNILGNTYKVDNPDDFKVDP